MRKLSFVGLFLAVLGLSQAGLAAPVVPAPVVPAPVVPAPVVPHAVEVSTTRVHFHDLGIAGTTMPDVDLGPAPPMGATRTIDRDEVTRALTAASAAGPQPKLPAQFRITRKAKRLANAELDKLVRDAVDPATLPKGATLTGVRGTSLAVPDGYDRVSVVLPVLPRRSGTVTVTAAVTFVSEGDVIARATVPVDFDIPAGSLIPDILKGAPITLVVRKGLVEVSIGAVAGADGDTGGILPVLLKPSGRVVRARMIDRDHALALEDS